MLVSNKELKAKIESLETSHVFSVTFIKRSTGEQRDMLCRKGVKVALKGGPPAYRAADHNLIHVYDMQKSAYRSINLETLLRAKIDGVTYIVRRKVKK